LSELDRRQIGSLADLNARLWAWLEQIYHQTPHEGLHGRTPLARYQQDLPKIRSLGALAPQIDALFLHRVRRLVRKDGSVSYQGTRFEVPYELSGKKVLLVVDPHEGRVVGVEDDLGNHLGAATVLDTLANAHRQRRTPAASTPPIAPGDGPNLVELAHRRYYRKEH